VPIAIDSAITVRSQRRRRADGFKTLLTFAALHRSLFARTAICSEALFFLQARGTDRPRKPFEPGAPEAEAWIAKHSPSGRRRSLQDLALITSALRTMS
jgi:hypothetical protein